MTNSPADKDGRLKRGDRLLSINGLSMRGLTHRESLSVLKVRGELNVMQFDNFIHLLLVATRRCCDGCHPLQVHYQNKFTDEDKTRLIGLINIADREE